MDSQKLELLPTNFETDLFRRNREYFERELPEFHKRLKSHTSKRYFLFQNPDESFNIYDSEGKKALYPIESGARQVFFNGVLEKMNIVIGLDQNILDPDLSKKKANPYLYELRSGLLEQGIVSRFVNKERKCFDLADYRPSFLPLLRIYGIGTGEHIRLALERYEIANLVIHEPDFELFYASLFSLDWCYILETFRKDKNRRVALLASEGEEAFTTEKEMIDSIAPFFFRANARLFCTHTHNHETLIKKEQWYDHIRYFDGTSGWYEDQRTGLQNSIRNIKANQPFFTGKKTTLLKRVFLVGSGPSLNESIGYLVEHQHEAVIIACGSAITALVQHQVVPDFHVLQERTWNRDVMLKYASAEILQTISAFKLNPIETSVDDLYRKVLVFQKAFDPGSCLLDLKQFPQSYSVNPTVTNAGMAIASLIGAERIFLFGVDYGSAEQEEFLHAAGTIVKGDDVANKKSQYVLKGNFSAKVYSNEIFSWSHQVAEQVVSQNPQIKWINIGDGAEIAGTEKKLVSDLPPILEPGFDKQKAIDSIADLFSNNYFIEDVANRLETEHFPTSLGYLEAILEGLDTVPTGRAALLTTINLLSKAALVGYDDENYLPQKLFGFQILRFLDLVFQQIAVTESDEEAVMFYLRAAELFKTHANDIFEDFQRTVINEVNADA